MIFNSDSVISPRSEMIAYETLFGMRNQSLKSLNELFEQNRMPSEALKHVQKQDLFPSSLQSDVEEYLKELSGFSICTELDYDYPEQLRDSRYHPRVFYYRGDIGLTSRPSISVVGSRKASEEGLTNAANIARALVREKYVVVSGLAKGIDTAAMTSAIEAEGHTIGVIGTPLNEYYPKENKELQERVAKNHLLISQVPFYRYAKEPFTARRRYFPERNQTMAALSEATIIVEASDTSGTLIQARACLQQGRKLLILQSCFDNKDITWPARFEEEGAIRVRSITDILSVLRNS